MVNYFYPWFNFSFALRYIVYYHAQKLKGKYKLTHNDEIELQQKQV